MRVQQPTLRQVLVKLNEGVSGEGNALVDLEGLTIPGTSEHDLILQRLQSMKFELQGVTYDEYVGRNGSRLFEVGELRLANTFTKLPGLTFQKGRDDPADIDGLLSITVLSM